MKGAPRSEQFNDIYFSAEDGLAETQYVFLQGNNLPQSWDKKDSFVIAEAGFGTGLNFLSTWKLFEETSDIDQTLDFISIEKYPLTPEQIKNALHQWAEYFEGRIDILCALYPIRIAGFHRVKINSRVTLTLIFDDICQALPEINAKVDCWFLDGFAPSRNPDMWAEDIFHEMARLSNNGASFSSFTAAGQVRRGLISAGFSVEKKKGFSHKRDMIVGYISKKTAPSKLKKLQKIAIIGGGLAGTSCAYAFKKYGFDPIIYEASNQLAAGASGNALGLYNPRFSKARDALSDFFAPAYAQFISMAKQAGDIIEYRPTGALHLMMDDNKVIRYQSMAQNWMWHEDHIKTLDYKQASEIAGIDIEYAALFLPDAGSVCPKKLCNYYAQDCEVRFNSKISDLSSLDADVIILANGPGVNYFKILQWLDIDRVRGQVSVLNETPKSKFIKCNIHYSGYISPAYNGQHMVGSTFEKWIDHTKVTDKDHQANIETLENYLPFLKEESFEIDAGWAGMRVATNDRFPVIGAVPETDDIYVSTAFGSHGLVGSLAGAHYLVDLVRNGPKSLSQKSYNALNPKRFLDRAKKRGHNQ